MILILSDNRTIVFLVCKQAAIVCMGIHRDKLRMYGFHYMLCVMVQVRRNATANATEEILKHKDKQNAILTNFYTKQESTLCV